ncbi:MAG TPA: OB-fold domain-containing protein [Acidimicrobiales bacterium]|nr:OB-fold domain-containing protein [Acidimicrobiales bacterium]
MAASTTDDGVFRAPMIIEYPFSRTTGPVIGAFLTGLRERVLIGIKGTDGRVLIPPTEYDPATGEDLSELVEVGPGGVVDTWAWVRTPMPKHPLQRPFAWALVRPDGADVGFLQAVDAGSIESMATGMRVVPRWREEREGTIHDLECWEPEA